MKRWAICFPVGIVLTLYSLSSFAANLVDVYNQALKSDPTFKAAEAQWLAIVQLAPIAKAALLPSLLANGAAQEAHIHERFSTSDSFNQIQAQYSLTLNQIIFNYQAWENYKNAKLQVKQARANYDAAAQNLMISVASAYFAVLQAHDTLLATQAQKRSLAEQLHQTQEQFKVGLIAITGIEQVQASYDATVAQEIANKNDIANKLEELRAITGVFYNELVGIKNKLPLTTPQPANINAWAKVAVDQNYFLKAAIYGMLSAKENIKVQAAGHLPTVNAQAGYTYTYINEFDLGPVGVFPDATQTTAVAVNVNFPIYQGGLITAKTRQASYQYAQASAQMEQTYRNVLTQAREAYLGVISGIGKITADMQAIASNRASLNATKSGYTEGTQTIVDVLQQQSGLYSAETNYALDQYFYLNSILLLKQAAGTLSGSDLVTINSWLGKKIDFSDYNFDMKDPSHYLQDYLRAQAQRTSGKSD